MNIRDPAQSADLSPADTRVQPDGPLSGEVERGGAALGYQLAPKRRGPKPSAWCSVYLVEAASGVVKVGMSGDPAKRLNGLRTSAHEKLSLAHHWQLADREQAAALEAEIHRLFRWARKAREWFAVEVQEPMSVGAALIAGHRRRAHMLADELRLASVASGKFKEARDKWESLNPRWHKPERDALIEVIDQAGDDLAEHRARAFALGLEQNEWDASLFGEEISQARNDLMGEGFGDLLWPPPS